MLVNQRTLREKVSVSGVGLHTGNVGTITFCPAPENYGFKFVRTDLQHAPEIPAIVDYVTDIARGTTLTHDNASVHTVEHVLAALVGLEIDNCRIEIDNNEPPVGDGSALPFTTPMLSVGFEEQKAPKDYLVIDSAVRYVNESKGVEIVALPNDDFRITVMVDYHNPALGSQHSGLFDLEKEFLTEFAPSRTFCFLTEVEMLHKQGLIKGGSLDNAVVIVDKVMSQNELSKMLLSIGYAHEAILGDSGILNNNHLRFKNEPARHKLLDMLGDLALVGVPMKAQILAARPGHASNIEFARKIRKLYENKKIQKKYQIKRGENAVYDINAILKIMPHRYPFLLVDRIVEYDAETSRIRGYKNVTINEDFFNGHFPGRPVMPGVLILEAMGQTGGMLLLNNGTFDENKLVFFVGMDKVRFRKPVIPGDQLMMDITLVKKRFNTFTLDAKAYVDGNLVAEAELLAAIVDK